jgi:hypothetical protein
MTTTAPRLRVSYAQCSECRVIAEYYYNMDDTSQFDLAFTERCVKCDAAPSNLGQVIVTKG